MDFDQDSNAGRRNRAIGFSVLGLVALGVVLGLLVGGLGLAAMRSVGLNESESSSDPTREPPTQTDSGPVEPTPTEEEETRRPRPDRDRPTLTATPSAVGPMEQITLTGRFPRLSAGATLQVQRRVSGAWADFADVTATTQEDGSFSTYVLTGQTGTNSFRLIAEATGEATAPVQVEVG